MFPTPNPRNGLILSPVHQVTILHFNICSSWPNGHGVWLRTRRLQVRVLAGKIIFSMHFHFLQLFYVLDIPSVSFIEIVVTEWQNYSM